MDADTFQEDRLPIQQDLLATRLNHAETDAVADCGVVECDLHLITLGILRAPKLRLGLHTDRGSTVGIGLDRLLEFQLRDIERYRMVSLSLVQFDAERQLATFKARQLQVVILQIDRQHLYEHHISRDTAIVPPIENLSRHILSVTLVVHLYNHRS